jgi:hypothetical protein
MRGTAAPSLSSCARIASRDDAADEKLNRGLQGQVKVKSLSLTNEALRYDVLGGVGGCMAPRLLDLGTMEVSGQLHAPTALLPKKHIHCQSTALTVHKRILQF